jgi:4-hydroxybenzoyl-CoA thioesterase
MYERVWTVRFSDTDPFGIAHYPRIVDAVHETSDMFVEELGWPYWEMATEGGFGLPLVETSFEFDAPVEAGDRVRIGLTPRLSTRSVRFEYVARADDAVAFSGYEQRVCVDKDSGDARPLPDDLRAAMDPYAAADSADGGGDGDDEGG